MQSKVTSINKAPYLNKGPFHYDYLVLAVNSLINILKEEVVLLKKANAEELKKLQSAKVDLVNFIEKQQTCLIESKSILDGLSRSQKEELKLLHTTLSKVSRENKKELEGIRHCIETLMKVTSESLKNKSNILNTYNRMGRKNTNHLRVISPAITLISEA